MYTTSATNSRSCLGNEVIFWTWRLLTNIFSFTMPWLLLLLIPAAMIFGFKACFSSDDMLENEAATEYLFSKIKNWMLCYLQIENQGRHSLLKWAFLWTLLLELVINVVVDPDCRNIGSILWRGRQKWALISCRLGWVAPWKALCIGMKRNLLYNVHQEANQPDDEIPSSLLKVQLKRFLDKISSLAVDSHTALV